MKLPLKHSIAALAVLLSLTGAAAAQVFVAVPQLRVEVGPPPPMPPGRWVLEPGHWVWNGASYVWVGRHWIHPRFGYAHFVPGHWQRGHWVPEHWVR